MKPMPETTALSSEIVALKDKSASDARADHTAAEAPAGWLSAVRERLGSVGPLFWLTVAIPTLLATLYFGFLASDVYISESRYVVRSPEKPQKNGLGLLLGGAGFSTASEEVRAAQGFIESRDALREINKGGFVSKAWGSESVSIFDRFNAFGWSGSFEDLYSYYGDKIEVQYDTETGITTLTARAFKPEDAQSINARLLERAEQLVNGLNSRGSEDLIRYAEREAAEAKAQASAAALELAAYRDRMGVLDPERQATVQLQMISKLQDELIGARMQLLQLTRLAAQNPQIPVLKVRVAGLERAIDEQLGSIAGNKGSLSDATAEYQRLQVQREFSEQQLGLSLAALQDARNEARRQAAYIERVAQPSLPDEALEPRRLRGILATLCLGLLAWGVISMLLVGVREHKD